MEACVYEPKDTKDVIWLPCAEMEACMYEPKDTKDVIGLPCAKMEACVYEPVGCLAQTSSNESCQGGGKGACERKIASGPIIHACTTGRAI